MKRDLTNLRNTPFTFCDTDTKNMITVSITENYLSIKINNRTYYFNSSNGKYDGYSDDLTTTINTNILSHTEAICALA